jgi:hypothetical protein
LDENQYATRINGIRRRHRRRWTGGLASAIRLKQLATLAGEDINVCLTEKSAEIGGTFCPALRWTRAP